MPFPQRQIFFHKLLETFPLQTTNCTNSHLFFIQSHESHQYNREIAKERPHFVFQKRTWICPTLAPVAIRTPIEKEGRRILPALAGWSCTCQSVNHLSPPHQATCIDLSVGVEGNGSGGTPKGLLRIYFPWFDIFLRLKIYTNIFVGNWNRKI